MPKKDQGFTIVELLIVIVIIAILAAVSVVAYTGVQQRAQASKIASDQANLTKAISLARTNTSQTLLVITGDNFTGSSCRIKAAGTDLASLPTTDDCWIDYLDSLDEISVASGMDVRNVVDPWGRPYMIDENEGEAGPTYCFSDWIAVYRIPFPGNVHVFDYVKYVPLSMSACV